MLRGQAVSEQTTITETPIGGARGSGHGCDHCSLPVPLGLVVEGRREQFCCHGCESAYRVIHGCGLDAYYRLREQAGDASNKPATIDDADRVSAFDTDKFHELYVRRRDDGLLTCDLMLEGVHCAACVWLVEKLPRVVPGVIEARLSLREAIVRVTWDPQQVALSKIARSLGTLGYRPHPARGGTKRTMHLAEQRTLLIRVGVAGAIAGNTMLLALALYAGMFGGIEREFENLFRWISAGLGVVALAWPGRVFFRGAWAAIRTRSPHLDLPIALALAVGGVAGLVNVVLGRGEIYFDSLTVLVFLLLVGRFIQYRQQRRADDAVELLFSLTPTSCRRVRRDDRGSEAIEQVPAEAVAVGDVLEVRAGELIPADGDIVSGRASVIASLITGESRPVAVDVGDAVCAGSQLADATVRLRVSAVGEDSRVGKLMALVQRGVADKPAIVALTDRVAGWFVVVVSSIALAVFAAWSVFDLGAAVDHTVALLIVACPCALGLATPLSLAVAIGRSAKRDILIKSGAVFDRLAKPGRLLLDKTGTLTRGAMRVEQWHGDPSIKPLVAEVERHATHPIARAIVSAFGGEELPADERQAIREVRVNGRGVTAQTRRGELLVGSRQYLAQFGVAVPKAYQSLAEQAAARACTPVFVVEAGRVVALASVGDAVHADAVASLRQLEQWGWSVTMLTGDERLVAEQVAGAVGLKPGAVSAGVTPEQKLTAAQQRGEAGPVVMVGDGVNDAAALAAADVGVAVSGGAEPSLAAADVYLARPGLSGLVELIASARRTRRVIRRNLAVSLAYNALAIGLAAAGLINPLVAAVLMPLSSALVLALAVGGQGLGRPVNQPTQGPAA
ncbi:MAG: heavy metal translocating P-type ATPase [Phycisphaeraceae bacterium]